MTNPLVVVAAAACLLSCGPHSAATAQPRPAGSPAVAGQAVELRVDEAVEADGVRLTLKSVSDSRCPREVTCVWAGEVTIELDIREEGEDQRLTLTTGPRPNADTARTRRHELRLLDVTPYPRQGVEVARSDIRARVDVRRL